MATFFRKTLIVSSLAGVAAYWAFRATTLNLASPAALAVSALLYAVELFAGFRYALFCFDVWHPESPELDGAPAEGGADVFVLARKEDLLLIRGTLAACRRMQRPHELFLVDHCDAPEARELAERYGAHYLATPGGSRAECLNNALLQSANPFVAILAADQAPTPEFLDRMLACFGDPKLAFAQTQLHPTAGRGFPAPDAPRGQRPWDEQQLFFQALQPGANHWNAAKYAGSAAVFRRTALQEAGGFATDAATEDWHTGLRLHARGWSSLFVDEPLVAAQSTLDAGAFHARQLRSGAGEVRAALIDNPIFCSGLSLAQRLSYLSALMRWFAGPFRAALYAVPILVLTLGVAPLRPLNPLTVGALAAYVLALAALPGWWVGNAHSFLGRELFAMAGFWSRTRALFRALARPRQAVVDRHRRRPVWRHAWPHVALVYLSMAALLWAWLRVTLGFVDTPWLFGAASLAALFHAGLALVVVQRTLEVANVRRLARHAAHLPVRYRIPDGEGGNYEGIGITADLNSQGLSLMAYQPLPVGAAAELAIVGEGQREIAVAGVLRTLLRQVGAAAGTREAPAFFRYGVEFQDLSPEQFDALGALGLRHAAPWAWADYRPRGNLLARMAASVRRKFRRHGFRLPVAVHRQGVEQELAFGATEDISAAAFRFRTPAALPGNAVLQFFLGTPFGAVQGLGRVLRQEESPRGGYEVVLEYQKLHGDSEATLRALLFRRPLREAVAPGLAPNAQAPRVEFGRAWAVAAGLVCVALPLTAVGFRATYGDDFLLRAAADLGRDPNPAEVKQLKAFAARTLLDPEAPLPRLRRFRDLWTRQGDASRLHAVLEEFARRSPHDVAAQREWAADLSRSGQHAAAETRFAALHERLANAPPSERGALALARGRNLVAAQRVPDALPHLTAAAELAPESVEVRRELIAALAAAGRPDLALRNYGWEPNPDDRRMRLALMERVGDLVAAERECRELLKALPGDPAARRKLPELLERLQRPAEAIPLIQQELAHGADDLELRRRLLALMVGAGQFEGAEVQARAILARKPDDAEARRLLPNILAARRNYAGAVELYRTLVPVGADAGAARRRLVRAVGARGALDEAKTLALELVREAPQDPAARRLALDVLLARRDFGEAAALLGPGAGAEEKLLAGKLLLWQGLDRPAAQALRPLLAEKAAEPRRAYLDAALGLASLEPVDQAAVRKLYLEIVAAPDQAEPAYLTRVAAALRAAGEPARSEEMFAYLLQTQPRDQTLQRERTASLLAAGRAAEADAAASAAGLLDRTPRRLPWLCPPPKPNWTE